MRCPRCGNENPDDNRFCGMCGALLTTPPVADTQTQRAASSGPASSSSATPVARPVAPPRPPERQPQDAPVISGPSFLGLNDPVPSKRASLSIDPHSQSSRNLDYLLEDDDHPRGGVGKVLFILFALVLAAGLGYLRWRNHQFPWGWQPSKPTAASQPSNETENNQPVTPSASATPEAPAQSQPAGAPAQSPPPSTTDSGSAASPAPAAPAASPTATNQPPATNPAPSDHAKPNTAAQPAANSDDSDSEDEDQPAATAKPQTTKPAVEKPTPKPHAEVTPSKPVDTVSEAQKFLYGRGAAQDCDRGLRLLKPAANAANPKAMVEMGALYSAGLCTPKDLPTAYRWFALALRKQPDNQAIQADLQKLWGEMTQPERQLAIKLTQ